MVCTLERPTPQALFDKVRGLFEANVLGGYDVIPESIEWYVVANDYAMMEEFYSVVSAQFKAQDPRNMCCDDLFEYAANYGIFPRAANFAEGYVRIKGTPGTLVPLGLNVTIQGQSYNVYGSYPNTIPSAGYIDVRVRAVVPGVDGNIAVTSGTGTLNNATAGISTTVEVFGSSFCGGSAEESCEEFRPRLLARLAYRPRSNSAWIIEKLLEWPCVTRAFARGGSCCETTEESTCCNTCIQDLNFYVMFDGTFDCGIPPECVIDDINTWLFGDPVGKGLGEADIGICGKVYAPVASIIDVAVSGVECATANQKQEIRDRIADVFLTAAPSTYFSRRTVELAIAQVVGTSDSFEVSFTDTTGNMTFDDCGNLDPNCDILPCLGNITIVGDERTLGC